MIFRKKKKLRNNEDNELLWHLDVMKNRVKQREELIESSFDHHVDVVYRAKLEKAKYLFLLKEARFRGTGLKKR
ncbi:MULTISPECIES: YaaL family protein [Bacillaceae]|uniref:YaaL family protein n=1 Tax=Evansella alkalicola TaxID=745819 RepID=A0ABS6JSI2_9BACI|nr:MULTISPECIES: YaaL family protein [Bacillaceae]MBU9721521.1 YaaL family protein [Bacillus alkalicola]